MLNVCDKIIAYESGELTPEQVIDLFAELVKTGLAWALQGHYGRTARDFISAGVINGRGDVLSYDREPV